MPALPRRRWFRYSLRTMLVVVTVFAVWLGWELKFVRERKAFLDWTIEERHIIRFTHFDGPAPAVPFWRRWLGDAPVQSVMLPHGSSEADLIRAQSLFPEAFEIGIEDH